MTRSNQDMADVQQEQQTIADYVGDRVASESRIEEALGRPLTEVADDPVGRRAVQNLHDMVKQDRKGLGTMQEEAGTPA